MKSVNETGRMKGKQISKLLLVFLACTLISFVSGDWVRPETGSSSTGTVSFNYSDYFNQELNTTSIQRAYKYSAIDWSNITIEFAQVLNAPWLTSFSESHTNSTQNNTADWTIDLINIPAGFADGTDNTGSDDQTCAEVSGCVEGALSSETDPSAIKNGTSAMFISINVSGLNISYNGTDYFIG